MPPASGFVMPHAKRARKEDATKREVVEHPGRDDVHEQRELEQSREAVVAKPKGAAGRTPAPTAPARARRRS